MDENIYSTAFKFGLRHSPFYFLNIGGYFASIEVTVAKIRTKEFNRRLLYGVFGIWCAIFKTLEAILPQLDVGLP